MDPVTSIAWTTEMNTGRRWNNVSGNLIKYLRILDLKRSPLIAGSCVPADVLLLERNSDGFAALT
jgi:hypothetical protein